MILELLKRASADIDPKEWAIYSKETGKIVSPTTYISKAAAQSDFDEFFNNGKHEIKPFDRKKFK